METENIDYNLLVRNSVSKFVVRYSWSVVRFVKINSYICPRRFSDIHIDESVFALSLIRNVEVF